MKAIKQTRKAFLFFIVLAVMLSANTNTAFADGFWVNTVYGGYWYENGVRYYPNGKVEKIKGSFNAPSIINQIGTPNKKLSEIEKLLTGVWTREVVIKANGEIPGSVDEFLFEVYIFTDGYYAYMQVPVDPNFEKLDSFSLKDESVRGSIGTYKLINNDMLYIKAGLAFDSGIETKNTFFTDEFYVKISSDENILYRFYDDSFETSKFIFEYERWQEES